MKTNIRSKFVFHSQTLKGQQTAIVV